MPYDNRDQSDYRSRHQLQQNRRNAGEQNRHYWDDLYSGRNEDRNVDRGRWEQAGDRSIYDQNREFGNRYERSRDYDNRQTNRSGWNQGRHQYGDEDSNRGRGNSGFYGASDYSQGRQMGYGNDRRGGYYGNAEEYSGSGVRRQNNQNYGRRNDGDYDREYARYQGRYGHEGYREENRGRGNYGAGYQGDFNRNYDRRNNLDSYGQGAGFNEQQYGKRSGNSSNGGDRYGNYDDNERGYRDRRRYDDDYGYGAY
jgi:23S rRNA pseudouridine2605 synthase